MGPTEMAGFHKIRNTEDRKVYPQTKKYNTFLDTLYLLHIFSFSMCSFQIIWIDNYMSLVKQLIYTLYLDK